jgi:hypothetical protein
VLVILVPVDAHVPRSRFGLDLLIGEAKRRMRRRRVLVVLAAAAAAVVLIVHPWGGSHAPWRAAKGTASARNGIAFAPIPGMTLVAADLGADTAMSSCNGPIGPGGHYPQYCSTLKPRDGRWERWVSTSAYEQGFKWSVRVAFAREHPGPVEVQRDWVSFASRQDMALFMSVPGLGGPTACSQPVPALHGGRACASRGDLVLQGTPQRKARLARTRGTQGEAFGFTWTTGLDVVRVKVSGVGLTLGDARQIALLAQPR